MPALAIKLLLLDNNEVAVTAANPFKRSSNNTAAASDLPAIRSILVVPGFCEPVVLGSGNFSHRHNKMALEIEPNKYAIINIPNNLNSIGAICMLSSNNQYNQNTTFINDLSVKTTIGIQPWETAAPQTIIISLAISSNDSQSTTATQTCSHQAIIELLTTCCQQQVNESLETLVANLEQAIIATYPDIVTLELSIKQPFPATNVKDVGISIARYYSK